MTRPKRITAAWLAQQGACHDQLLIFRRAWPTGTRLTRAAVRRAGRLHLNLDWLVTVTRIATAPAQRAYRAAKAPARQTYEATVAEAWPVYAATVAEAWPVYEEACVEAWRAYEAALAEALADALGLP